MHNAGKRALFAAVVTLFIITFRFDEAVAQAEQQAYFITIDVNGVGRGGVFSAFQEGGTYYLRVEDFEYLGFVLPDIPVISYRGRSYLPISAVPGLTFQFNEGQLHLAISCQPSCFPGNILTRRYDIIPPDPTPLGLFVNYDVLAEKSKTTDFFAGMAEVGVFSNHGSGNLTFTNSTLNGDSKFTRLTTNWTIDYPEKRLRLRLGDSISQHGGWGRAVRFGGVQFGTDFGLQPGFVSFPTPTISGSASLPSTAEIFVNGIRRAQIDLDSGPFTIEQPPVITGAGNLHVVVTDVLGREAILNQPFYASRKLLRPDLVEFSVEAGVLRTYYAVNSNDYQEPFVSGTYRRGINNAITAGVHAEASTKRAGIGPYVDWQTPIGGIFSGAIALSAEDGRTGGLVQLDFSWESETWGVSASNEWISKNFTRLGTFAGFEEPRMRSNARVSLDVSDDSALSLNYTRIDERLTSDLEVLSANYSLQVGNLGSLSFNVARSFGEFNETSLFLVFTRRLGTRATGSVSTDYDGDRWRGNVRVNQNAPSDGGIGFRGEISVNGIDREQAGVTYVSNKGIVTLDHSRFGGKNATRVGMRGGFVWMDGHSFLSRPIDDSFAVVKVGNFEGIGLLRDNRLVERTNSAGLALISRLRPYEENKISIDPLDLPMTADIGAISLRPVPRRRSGVMLEFSVSQSVAAVLRLVDDDGTPLPTGTVLRSVDSALQFPIGFGGETYITGLDQPLVLNAHVPSGDCTVRLEALKPSRFPKRLGTLVCTRENPR